MALPAPSIVTYEKKQVFMAIWQAFPLWVGILQEIIPSVQRALTGNTAVMKTKKQIVDSMRTVYAIMLTAAVVTRISTWTILDTAVLFPSIFAPDVAHTLTPSAVLKPMGVTPSVKMPSIATGALQFLQYDEMVGAAAIVLWSSALYINQIQKKSLGEWVSLVVKGIVIEALAGPHGLAVAAVWARDEIIFAEEHDAQRKDL
ncbi:MAG: hypothetical protein LQ338_002005 [Usnochroma carphineum]|nr:MAG: hypothetical protein LQ338_002005 [Usnochroma carphineum]